MFLSSLHLYIRLISDFLPNSECFAYGFLHTLDHTFFKEHSNEKLRKIILLFDQFIRDFLKNHNIRFAEVYINIDIEHHGWSMERKQMMNCVQAQIGGFFLSTLFTMADIGHQAKLHKMATLFLK